MALQSSGAISLSQIQEEHGGTNPISLSEYYRGAGFTTNNNTSVPTSGTIDMADFYSTLKAISVTYEFIGAGGGGGAGDTSTNNGSAGGDSTLTFRTAGDSTDTTLTSSGGEGGLGGHQTGWGAGENSYYGNGGSAGASSDSSNQTAGYSPAATSYGAGGGGGGAHTFSERNGGVGGGAGGTEGTSYTITAWNSSSTLTRHTGMPSTGTLGLEESTDITVVIGEGGAGGTGFTQGAKGANGYAKLTHQGIDYEYTSVGTHTVAVEQNYLAGYRNNEKHLQEITVSDYISSGETFIISEDTWVWSDDTAVAALTIDIPCTIINRGKIIGRGGDGGDETGTTSGGDGGNAIKINSGVTGVTITNNSGAYIAGGGGGGGYVNNGNNDAGGGGGAGGGIGGVSNPNVAGYNGGNLNAEGSGDNSVVQRAEAGGAGGYADESSGGSQYGYGGGGGGRILPGTQTPDAIAGRSDLRTLGKGGGANQAGTSGGTSGNGARGHGGGGWGAAGGGSNGGAAGKAIEDSGVTYTLTNNGTIYGATT